MPMVNDPVIAQGGQPPTAATWPQQNQAGAIQSWDAVRWFFNVTAAQQHDDYSTIIIVAGTVG